MKSNDRPVNTVVVNLTLDKSSRVVPARKFKWTGPVTPEFQLGHFKSGRDLTFNNHWTNIDESIYLYCQYNNQSKVVDFIDSKI